MYALKVGVNLRYNRLTDPNEQNELRSTHLQKTIEIYLWADCLSYGQVQSVSA